MLTKWSSTWTSLIAAVLLAVPFQSLLTSSVMAQDQQPSSQQGQQGQGGQSGQPKAQVAHVGAGTTDGSTTGVSGPEETAPAGEISLPPLPSEDLCKSYADTPAYQSCLGVVLRQQAEGGEQ